MDSTTEMQVKGILKNKYYRQGQTLGEGGWNEISSSTLNWKRYFLFACTGGNPFFDEIEWIVASDDEVAKNAFSSLYHLDMFDDWEIQERIVEYRLVSIK